MHSLSVGPTLGNAASPEPPQAKPVFEDSTGVLEGEVHCGEGAVAFANVVVLGTRLGAQTDENGRFHIERVPTGLRKIRVLAIGSDPLTDSTVVSAGVRTSFTFNIKPARFYWYENLRKFGAPFFLSYSDTNLIVKDCQIKGDWMRASSGKGSFQVTSSVSEPATLAFDYELNTMGFLSVEVSDLIRTSWKRFPRRRVSSGRITWDGKDDHGQPVPNGRYIVLFMTDQDSVRITVYRGIAPRSAVVQF